MLRYRYHNHSPKFHKFEGLHKGIPAPNGVCVKCGLDTWGGDMVEITVGIGHKRGGMWQVPSQRQGEGPRSGFTPYGETGPKRSRTERRFYCVNCQVQAYEGGDIWLRKMAAREKTLRRISRTT